MSRAKDLFFRTEETRAEFVKTDLDLAITIARNALSAPKGSDRRQRNTNIAVQAFRTLTRFVPKLIVENDERDGVDEKMSDLRRLLSELDDRS